MVRDEESEVEIEVRGRFVVFVDVVDRSGDGPARDVEPVILESCPEIGLRAGNRLERGAQLARESLEQVDVEADELFGVVAVGERRVIREVAGAQDLRAPNARKTALARSGSFRAPC